MTKRKSEDIEEDIERLRDWLLKQPHLPHNVVSYLRHIFRVPEKVLLEAFVHGTKTLEIAKKKLDAYISSRNRYPKIYDIKARDASSKRFKDVSSPIEYFFLPKTTPEGYRVLGIVTKDKVEDLFDHPHEINKTLMMGELGFNHWPDAEGVILFIDTKTVPSTLLSKVSPPALVAAMKCYQDGFPVKAKHIIIFNTKPFIEFIINTIIKPVTSEKLFRRIKITAEDESSLKDIIPKEILPSNYGGKEKSSAELNEIWMNIMSEKRDWFKKSCKLRSDESKRPPDSNNTYGIEGTFRKLAVD